MEIVAIDRNNIDQEHICCAIGNDKANQERAQSKKEWLKERFEDGLVFKRFDVRGKLFIEYMPIEKAWKPVSGKNQMLINCLWVSGQFKGQGLSTRLLDECIKDAKALKMEGMVVVSSTKVKPFLTDKKFYLKHGFEVVDSAPPYFELLALKIEDGMKPPEFTGLARKGVCSNRSGFTAIYANQCPFMEEYVGLLSRVAINRAIPFTMIKLQNHEEAQQIGSPFGTLGIYYNGEFKTHELMPEKKFEKFLAEVTG